MISFDEFIPDKAAEKSVKADLTKFSDYQLKNNPNFKQSKEVEEGLQKQDMKFIYDHAEFFAKHHSLMLYAAELNCLPLFKLRMEGLGITTGIENFIPNIIIYNSLDVLRYFKNFITDFSEVDKDLYSSFHWAGQRGSKEVMELLLSFPGIQIDKKDGMKATPFKLAIKNKNYENAALLMKAGFKLDEDTIIKICLLCNQSLIDAMLTQVKDLNFFPKKSGINPLQAVIIANDINGVQKFLKAGADVNLVSKKELKKAKKIYPAGSNAIEFAVIAGNQDIEKIVRGK